MDFYNPTFKAFEILQGNQGRLDQLDDVMSIIEQAFSIQTLKKSQ